MLVNVFIGMIPRHPKTQFFVKSGLFMGLESFQQLEDRICNIEKEKDRGDAFEVFAEAYLATQRKHEAKEIWPLGSVPLDLLQRTGLTTNDYGIDGLYTTPIGDLNAYQVKYRAKRPSLNWRELSTFLGLADSPNIKNRVLITNCDEFPDLLNQRGNFFCIRGGDLDRLDKDSLKEIAEWVSGSVHHKPRKEPRAHQKEAIEKILSEFSVNDRATAVMACGTGKTLVGLWVMEELKPTKAIVLMPSLALIRQTLHEWLRETSLPNFSFLCVCSDHSVAEGVDSVIINQADLDFNVTTDPTQVRSFLDNPFDGTKVVFTTYYSAPVISESLIAGEQFDYGVFDEAHKTTGKKARRTSFALTDDNIHIYKRLFLTATPRSFSLFNSNEMTDPKQIYSMDNVSVYGGHCVNVTFARAVAEKLICPYQVVISVITSATINNRILDSGEVYFSGKSANARDIANQIALQDAVSKYGVKKIFTFHKTVKEAAELCSNGELGISNQITDCLALHINGAMNTSLRERVMKDFCDARLAVLSNARCLTEGVDVPAVDMVAFLSPRKSQIDIIQAAGRAMRNSEGKERGYILVPLFVEQEQDESVEAAVARLDFSEVWEVLRCLQEHDEVFHIGLAAISEKIGRKGISEIELPDNVKIDTHSVSIDALRRAIMARLFKPLLPPWEHHFGELQRFKEKNGHCNVPKGYKESPHLGTWVGNMRALGMRNKLSSQRREKLEGIGFCFKVRDAQWDENIELLKVFKRKHGHTRVSINDKDNLKLGRWIANIRLLKKDGKLPNERQRELIPFNIDWDLRNQMWEEHFESLLQFIKKYGHTNVPQKYPTNQPLAFWCEANRRAYRDGDILPERAARLERIGFKWNKISAFWDEMFNALLKFKEKHGHCNVSRLSSEDKRLFYWVANIRNRFKVGDLPASYRGELDKIGFIWKREDAKWNDNLTAFIRLKEKLGHSDIRPKHSKEVYRWIRTVRECKSKYSTERLKQLNDSGFPWNRF